MTVKLTCSAFGAPTQISTFELLVKEIRGNSDRLCFILTNGDYRVVEREQIKEIIIID